MWSNSQRNWESLRHKGFTYVCYRYSRILLSSHVLLLLLFLGIRTRDDDNGLEEEENFEEALKAVNTALVPTRVPSGVTAILADPKCSNLVNKCCLSTDRHWHIGDVLALNVNGFSQSPQESFKRLQFSPYTVKAFVLVVSNSMCFLRVLLPMISGSWLGLWKILSRIRAKTDLFHSGVRFRTCSPTRSVISSCRTSIEIVPTPMQKKFSNVFRIIWKQSDGSR